LEVAERAVRLEELVDVDPAETELDVDHLGLGRALEPALEQSGEVLPALFALIELLEGVERAHVERVERADALVVADGLAEIADDLLGDEGHFVEELDALLLLGRALGGPVVELLELAPALGRRENLLQPVEGAVVRGVDREHTLEVGHRALGI